MIDIRNEANLSVPSLWDTDALVRLLSGGSVSGPFFIEKKLDGQRATLQMGPSGCFLISRSRHGKTKGVEAAALEKFVAKPLEDWMVKMSKSLDYDVLVDGELCVAGDLSTSADVTRIDTLKVFVAFDIMKIDDDWCNDCTLAERRELLVNWREAVLEGRDDAHRLQIVDYRKVDSFGQADLEALFKEIRESPAGLEGFVLKRCDSQYKWGGTFGWKVKTKDNEDGWIVDANEEKKHHMGKVTKTGNVGSVALAQQAPDGRTLVVAWVGIPSTLRVPLARKNELMGQVVEFEHRGWDGKGRFRFPRFVQIRTDKSADQCKLRKRITIVEDEGGEE